MLAIYTRLSVNDEESNSLENQIREGRDFAKANGFKKLEIYNEGHGISGGADIKDRPELDKMMRDIATGKISTVWMRNQNRLERNSMTFHLFADLARKHKTSVVFGDKETDWDDPSNFLQSSILTAINSYQRELQSYQTKKVLSDNAKEGKAHGKTPYGYDVDKDNKYVPHAEHAEVIRMIYNWSANGETTPSIIKKLNKLGINPPEGSKWAKSTLNKILKKRLYLGERKFNGTLVPMPQIIDKETYQKARETVKKHYVQKGKPQRDRFYLNGLINCRECEGRYLGTFTKKPYYECTTRREHNNECKSRNIRQTYIEDFVWFLLTVQFPKEVEEVVANNEELEILESRIGEYRAKLLDLDRQEERQADLMVKGAVSMTALTKISERIERERTTAMAKIRDLEEELKGFDNPDLTDLKLTEAATLPNSLKKEIAQKFILSIDIWGNDLPMRIDIKFKAHGLKMSYYVNNTKGYIMSRDRAILYITGKGLIKSFDRASDKLKWWHKEPELLKTHKEILKTSYVSGDLIKGHVDKVPKDNYTPSLLTKKDGTLYEDRNTRVTEILFQ
ncbi:recombinase family protein [Maribacter sp. CXY002]|uniref:recombinase family protein n=1 Tax=Maribacter luteocoastalis TaxID=3407671 RepID=UPI003B66E966